MNKKKLVSLISCGVTLVSVECSILYVCVYVQPSRSFEAQFGLSLLRQALWLSWQLRCEGYGYLAGHICR